MNDTKKWVKEIRVTWSVKGKEKTMFVSCWSDQIQMKRLADDEGGGLYIAIAGYRHAFKLSADEYFRVQRILEG